MRGETMLNELGRCPLPAALATELKELFAHPERIGLGLPSETVARLIDLTRWVTQAEQVGLRLAGWEGVQGDALDVPLEEGETSEAGLTILPLEVPLLPSGQGPRRRFGTLALQGTEETAETTERLAVYVAAQLVHDALQRSEAMDRLTGLLSRTSFERLLPGLPERFEAESLSVVMLDLDDLRQLNATQGPSRCDELLARLGTAARGVLGDDGVACRYGGDEIVLVLPGDDGVAVRTAQRLIGTLLDVEGFGSPRPSASAGVASCARGEVEITELVLRADQALARAKQEGRGQVVGWSEALSQERGRDRLAGIFTGDPARDYRNVQALLDTVRAVSSLAPLEETLVEVVDRCIEVSGAARGLLLLQDEQGWTVRVARQRGGRALTGSRVFAASLADEALSGGRALARLAQDEMPVSASGDVLGLKAVLCAPLSGPDVPPGVVYVDTPEVVGGFDPATIAFFDALAAELGNALRNSVLHSRVLLRAEELAKDVAGREAELVRLRRRWAEDRALLGDATSVSGLIGRAPAMRDVFATLQSLEGTEVPVVVEGESGTGKELVSRAIHNGSPRSTGPLITVNCAAIAPGLFESELFGHTRGAFTGADADREGLLEAANGGTLFLDEVGELPLEAQAKLLRALQEKEIRRLGEAVSRPIDVRIVAATNRDLRAMIASGSFRQDLYYRLAVFRIHLPPLRERPEDIPLLVDHLLEEQRSRGRKVGQPSAAAMQRLVKQRWPGNVRELRNVLERAVVLAGSDPIEPDHIAGNEQTELDGVQDSNLLRMPLKDAKAKFAAIYAREAIRRAEGSVPEAAKRAGVTRQTLYRILSNEPASE